MNTRESTLLNKVSECEAIADLLAKRAADLKEYCHRTRAKLEGDKTPSRRKAVLSKKQKAAIVARRNKYIFKNQNSES